jgi:hypothetical protein
MLVIEDVQMDEEDFGWLEKVFVVFFWGVQLAERSL